MNIKKLAYWLIPCLLLFQFSCNEKLEPEISDGDGWLAVEFIKDNTLVQSRAENEDYILEIQKMDGSTVATYNYSEIQDRLLIKSGNYKLIATNGENVIADFEKPFYKDSTEVNIEIGSTKAVTMICSLANVKFSVDYSQKFKDNFVDYSLEVSNGMENGILIFNKDENRSGYMQPYQGTIVWKLSLNNGQEIYELTKTVTGVEARQHYKFYFDIKEGGDENDGAFVPGIVVDTSTNIYHHEYEIVLRDSIARPVINGVDFNLNEPLLILDETRGVSAKIEIEAEAKIQALTIKHESNVLKGLGIPNTFTPSTISVEEAGRINAAGILWSEQILDEQFAWIDFSALLNNTSLGVGEYDFSIEVLDARNKIARANLNAVVMNEVSHLPEVTNEIDIWATFTTISGKWLTEEMPLGLGLQYSTDQQNWTNAENVIINAENKTFNADIKGLVPSTTYYYRTVSEGYISSTVYSFATDMAEQYPYLNFDDWYQDGKSYYLGTSGATKYWDSGNKGANSVSSVNPTSPEYEDIVNKSGNIAAARLNTKMVNAVIFKVMAAGSIYTGAFGKVSGIGAELNFGMPYTARPTTLKGYYKYNPQPISETSNKVDFVKKGDLDSCHIYIALFSDWDKPFTVNTNNSTFVDFSKAMAFGELKDSRTMDSYEEFTINIEYRDKTKRPTYILIVASSSKYGDYFVGGEGSILLIDEFELGFDAPLDN